MWIILSLLAGLGDALRDAGSKSLTDKAPREMVSWSYSILALPYFVPFLIMRVPETTLPWDFYALLALISSCHVIGGLLLVRALQISDLSLCAPIGAFSPVFLLVIGPLLTGDSPSTGGVVGTLFVVCGCYLLNIRELRRGLFAPIRALSRDRGVRLMLGLTLLWSFTGSIDRIAVAKFDRQLWGISQLVMISILFLPVVALRKGITFRLHRQTWGRLLMVGGFNALSFGTYLVALQLAPVFYVVCVKRSSILFSIIFGRVAFNEAQASGRILGGALMVVGIAVISIWR